MGMFDTIQCEKPLPGEPKPPVHAWLQSKDFKRGLEVYRITADDRLIGLSGEALPFHGILNFYTYEDDIWFEYEAKFTDGVLIEICPVSIYLSGVGGPKEVYFPVSEK
jgi:hypothetical protein